MRGAATLSIGHNAAASPSTVALSGTGTATAQPAVSLSASTLDFGTASLGTKSAAQAITLTNSGQAPLTLASLTLGGTAGGDFALAGTCANGATIAPGGTCTLQLTFAPTAVGTRSGTLTVTSNAANGNPVVALSGSGVQYAISVNPAALSMQSPVGVMSTTAQAVITDSGASPITLSSITITGPFSMQQGSNSCGAGPMDLTPGQSCSVYVAFYARGRRCRDGRGGHFLGIADPTHAHRVDRTGDSRSDGRVRHDVAAVVVARPRL